MKKLFILITVLAVLFSAVPAGATEKNLEAITATTYLLADGTTGAVMLEENGTTNLGVNNFAKIMTAVLAIEKFAPTDLLTFTEQTNKFYGNTFGNIANTAPGQQFTVLQHLQNMLLLYSDASAVALGTAYSGSAEKFVDEMNKKAKAIGMKDTVFTSPDGHDDQGSAKTTVHDLYLLMRYAMKLPLFREITATVRFAFPSFSGGEERAFTSRNHLLSKYTYSTYTYSSAKSGFISYNSDSASYIGVAAQGNRTLYALVMNTPDDAQQVYKDVINLFEHGFNSYTSVILAKKGAFLHQVPVTGAMESSAVLVAEKDVSALLPVGYDEKKVTYKIKAPEKLKAPVKKGETYATATYYYDGNELTALPLTAEKDLSFSPFGWIFRLFSGVNTLLILAIILVLILWLHLHMKKQRKKEELRRRKREILNESDK